MAERLLSGYYPGTPFTRKPTRGAYNRPEYTGTPVDDYFEHVMSAPPLSIPRWLWQQEVAQMEIAYKIHAGFKAGKGAGYLAAVPEEELEGLPGAAGVSVNLNLFDWLSDPGEQIKKHVSSHLRSIADKDDFVLRTRREMWRNQYLKDKRSPYGLSESYRANMSAYDQSKLAVGGGVATYDVYEEVRNNVPAYFQSSKNIITRNGAYTGASRGVISGLSAELTDKRGQFTNAKHREAVDIFSEKAAVADKVGNMGRLMGKLQGELDKKGLRIIDRKGEDSRSRERINKRVNQLWKETEKTRIKIDAVKARGGRHAKEVRELDRHVARLEANLLKTTKEHTTASGAIKRVARSFPGKKSSLYTAVGVRSVKLFNNNARGGTGGSYLKGILDKDVRNRKSALNRAIHSGEADISGAGKNMGAIASAMNADWEWNTAFDLVDAAEKGNLLNAYVWQTLIRPRIKKWTPSYYLGKAVNENLLQREMFKNKIKFRVGVSVRPISVRGGDHFKMSTPALKKMLDIDPTSKKAQNLIPFLEGKFMGSAGLTKDDAKYLKISKAWLKKNQRKFGLAFDPTTGELVDSAANRKILKKIYGKVYKQKLNPGSYTDPGKEKTTLMNKYKGFLARVQASTYGKVYRVLFKKGDMLRQKATQKMMMLVERALENILGVFTGGAGKVIAWVVRLVAAKVISKAINLVSDLFVSLKGFDFDAIYDLMLEAIKAAVGCLLAIIGCCSILVFSLVVMVMSLISAIAGEDITPLGGNIIGGSQVDITTMHEFDVSDSSQDLTPSDVTVDQ